MNGFRADSARIAGKAQHKKVGWEETSKRRFISKHAAFGNSSTVQWRNPRFWKRFNELVFTKRSLFFLSLQKVPHSFPRCLPTVGVPLLDFTGCCASWLPGSQAAGQCCLITGQCLRTNARKRQLVRFLNTTRAWDRLYRTHTPPWSWPRTPAPKKKLLRSWPCGPVRCYGVSKGNKDALLHCIFKNNPSRLKTKPECGFRWHLASIKLSKHVIVEAHSEKERFLGFGALIMLIVVTMGCDGES